MFCPQCGAKNPDGSKFCGVCGASLVRTSAPVPTSAAPGSHMAPGGYAAAPVVGLKPRRRFGKPVIAAAVAVVVIVAVVLGVFVVPSAMLSRSRYKGSFGLTINGTPYLTVTGNGDQMTLSMQYAGFFSSGDFSLTGKVDKVTRADDDVVYELGDITATGSDASSLGNPELSIIVPKDASASNPHGRWGIVLSDDSSGKRQLMSLVLTYTSDSAGKLELVAAQGNENVTQWANVLSADYDPYGSHQNGSSNGMDLVGAGRDGSTTTFSAKDTGTTVGVSVTD